MKKTFVGETGKAAEIVTPKPRGSIFHGAPVMVIPGTFLVRRDVLNEAGGYVAQLKYSENTELLLRVVDLCHKRNFAIGRIDLPLTIYNRENFWARADTNAYFENILSAIRYILETHESLFKRDEDELFNYLSVAGVNAARLRRYSEARQYFRHGVKVKPLSGKNYVRLVLASFSFMAQAAWLRKADSK